MIMSPSSKTLEIDIEIVTFSKDDHDDPRNWSPLRKASVLAILCALSFCSVFGSSSYAPAENQIRQIFGVNADVASTGLSLYVLGFALGPLLCPMSEMFGRKPPYLVAWPLLIVVIAPSAWVENLAVILVFRLLTGCCAACALNNGSGVIADMYETTPRSLIKAMGWYMFAPLSGPCFGSIVGFFVAAHSNRGLWAIRVHWFFVIALWPLVFLLPETHGPTILKHRAESMRKQLATKAYAAHELHVMTKSQLVKGHLGRPASMLFREPIIQGAAIWTSLAYSIIYFFFEVYPVVFIGQNNIPFQLAGLPFIGITVGMLIVGLSYPYSIKYLDGIKIPFIEASDGTPRNSPESPLKAGLIGCVLMPISLFWFAWTSSGDVYWIWPALAGVPFGCAMLSIFYSFGGYLTRTYVIYATSAQASNTFARSLIAAIFPVAAHSIINNLGTEWGVSLFGFLSFGLIPVPIIFIRYGSKLRQRSTFVQEAESIVSRMRSHAVEENMDRGVGDD